MCVQGGGADDLSGEGTALDVAVYFFFFFNECHFRLDDDDLRLCEDQEHITLLSLCKRCNLKATISSEAQSSVFVAVLRHLSSSDPTLKSIYLFSKGTVCVHISTV